MNAPTDDGGPAFPCQPLDGQGMPCNSHHDGMSLRDWFAGKAMQADLSYSGMKHESLDMECAKAYYKFADAMLAARKEAAS